MPVSDPPWHRALAEEHPEVLVVYQAALKLTAQCIREAADDQLPDLAGCRAMATRMVDGMAASPMPFMQLALRPTSDVPFYVVHPVNVAILLLEMAQGWPGLHVSQEDLALLGLLHDLGMAKLQHIITQPRRLTADERAEMQHHVALTHEMLSQMQDLAPEILAAATQDHERLDGTGYPHQHRRGGMHQLGSLLAVADIFEAMTHERPYQAARAPYLALRELLSAGAEVLEPAFLKLLVYRIGVYPVGSWVELTSREIARVVATRPGTPLRPLVEVMGSTDRRTEGRRRVLDLSVVAGVSITRWLDEAALQRYL